MSFNILVVDDSKTVRAVLRRAITLANIPVETIHDASNGREALDILEVASIDIVLTDIHMPVMGGVELVETMAESERLAGLPVVVISSDSSQSRHDQLQRLGVRAILTKPFSAENIKNIISETLGEQSHG